MDPMFIKLSNAQQNSYIHSFAIIEQVVDCNKVFLSYKKNTFLFIYDGAGTRCEKGNWVRFYGYLKNTIIYGRAFVVLSGIDINLLERVVAYVKRTKKYLIKNKPCE